MQKLLTDLPVILTETIDAHIHGSLDSAPMETYATGTLRALLEGRVVVADARGATVADTAELALRTIHSVRHLS